MNADDLNKLSLEEIFDRLGIKKDPKTKQYFAPWRTEKTGSVSIKNNRWKDFGDTSKKGSAIDLMIAMGRAQNVPQAMSELHKLVGVPTDQPSQKNAASSTPVAENFVWSKAKTHPEIQTATEYLSNQRKIPLDLLKSIQAVYGFTSYVGQPAENYGLGVVFPVYNVALQVVGVNIRYLDDKHPIGKRAVGETAKSFYFPSSSVLKAPRVWLVESPIDAISLTAAGCPAVAYLSASFVKNFPLEMFRERQELWLLADSDDAGADAEDVLFHRCLNLGLTPVCVDWARTGFKDPNEMLKAGKPVKELSEFAKQVTPKLFQSKAPRLPSAEWRAVETVVGDSIDSIVTMKTIHNEDGVFEVPEMVAGFRPYRVDSVRLLDLESAFTARVNELLVRQKFVVHYRRVGSTTMQRGVIQEEDIGKEGAFARFGFVHDKKRVAHMFQALSRCVENVQDVVQVVGLVQVAGTMKVVDSGNSYQEDKQCIYHRLRIPSAPQAVAAGMIESFKGFMMDETAVLPLVWSLGSLLKVFLGFWPHLVIVGQTASGKTSLFGEILPNILGVSKYDHTQLTTNYRQMLAIGNHCYPFIVDEAQRAGKDMAINFVDLMNGCYASSLRTHGVEGLFLLAAPVCLLGQDFRGMQDAAINSKMIYLPVDGLKIPGKNGQRPAFPFTSSFPVREFAEFLIARWKPEIAKEALSQFELKLRGKVVGLLADDSTSGRFIRNYAALLFATEQLFEFAGIALSEKLERTLVDVMNHHLTASQYVRRESMDILQKMADCIVDAKRPEDRPRYCIDQGRYLYFPAGHLLRFFEQKGIFFSISQSHRLISMLETDGFLEDKNVNKRMDGMIISCVVVDLNSVKEAGIHWPFTV